MRNVRQILYRFKLKIWLTYTNAAEFDGSDYRSLQGGGQTRKGFKIFQETYMDLHWIIAYIEEKKLKWPSLLPDAEFCKKGTVIKSLNLRKVYEVDTELEKLCHHQIKFTWYYGWFFSDNSSSYFCVTLWSYWNCLVREAGSNFAIVLSQKTQLFLNSEWKRQMTKVAEWQACWSSHLAL